MSNIENRYNVELKYIHNNKETEIKSEAIKYISIDNNYLDINFPILLLSLNIKSSLYDTMLSNIDKDTVTLTISKYNSDNDTKVMKNYIKGEFLYFFSSSDSNYNKELEKTASDDKESTSEAYRNTYMGLVSLDIVNYTRKIYNDVLSGTLQSIIYNYISSIGKVIIEPFDNNKSVKDLLIPPIVGIDKLIDYIYSISSFYKSQYIFFIDLTKTCYLLSCNGNGVKRKSNEYPSIIINVDSSAVDSKHKTLGMVKNSKKRCYELNINSKDYHFNKDPYYDKDYNKIISIDSMGNVSNITLPTSSNSKGTRPKLYRYIIGNTNKKNNIKYLSLLTDSVVSVVKDDIDTSVLTPEKSYNISNLDANKSKDGKYVLIEKKEIFKKEDEKYFTITVDLKLSKVVS